MKKEKKILKRELIQKLKILDLNDESQKKSIACSLIGHSRIQSAFFGYFNCGRCGVQVGDSLGGVYDASDIVIIGHECEACETNFKACDWRDKFMVPDPFA